MSARQIQKIAEGISYNSKRHKNFGARIKMEVKPHKLFCDVEIRVKRIEGDIYRIFIEVESALNFFIEEKDIIMIPAKYVFEYDANKWREIVNKCFEEANLIIHDNFLRA